MSTVFQHQKSICTHATNSVGKTSLKNYQILENVLEILRFPCPILRFPSPKIQFSSTKIQFSPHEIQFSPIGFVLSSTAVCFLQWLSTFFNGFPLSSTAFCFLQCLSDFLQQLSDFLQWLSDLRNPRKSIYGDKYTKDHYVSFVFFATRSPSFVISATIPNTLLWCTCVPNSAPYLKLS